MNAMNEPGKLGEAQLAKGVPPPGAAPRLSPYMSKCVFCKIANGAEPEHLVFENEHVLAFMDIQPLVDSKAHILVVPRKHYPTVDVLPDDVMAEIGRVMPRIARAVLKATGGTAFNIVQNNGPSAGQVVFHVHFHIVVRDAKSERSQLIAGIVDKLKAYVGLKDSMFFGYQVFARGQREDLVESDLAEKIRQNAKL